MASELEYNAKHSLSSNVGNFGGFASRACLSVVVGMMVLGGERIRTPQVGRPACGSISDEAYFDFLAIAWAACSITAATAAGLDTYTAWLPGTSVTVAPARCDI